MKHNLLLVCMMFSLTTMHAAVIGSDTAVTLISTMTTLNDGDIVTGFTALQGGFALNDDTVTATWNALFPVSNSITLNGGTLYLQRSLAVGDNTTLSLSGAIVGNSFTLNIAPNVTIAMPSSGGCIPLLAATQGTNLTPWGGSTETNAAGTVSWSFDDQFVIIAGQSSSGSNGLENYRFNGTSLTFTGSGPLNETQNCTAWHPSAYYVASGSASTTAVYSVDSGTGVLTLASSVATASSTCAWHPTGAYLVAGFSSNASLYPVDPSGTLGTPIPFLSFTSALDGCDWMKTGSYVALGTAFVTNNVLIYELSGTPALPILTLQTGFSVGSPFSTSVSTLAWNPIHQGMLAVGQGSNVSGDLVQLWQYDTVANTATFLTSISGISTNAINALGWSNDGTCLMVGLNKNTNPAADALQVYEFDAVNTTFTLIASSAFPNTSVYGTPGHYSPVNNYIAQLCAPVSSVGQLRVSVPIAGFSDFMGSNLSMMLHSDISLESHHFTLSGDCSILGNGNTLSLQATSALAIAANSTLTLKNLELTGLKLDAIQMLDSSSKLILDGVIIALDGNLTFTQGTLEIEKEVLITGQGAFIYSSNMPCVVDTQSILQFDNDITFSFVPASSARNLLQFIDSTSHLFLNGATLVTTQTGIDFTKGTLVVDRHAIIASGATVAAEGIAFGDGVDITNNMNLQVYPAAVLEVTQGIVVDNNL